jgi:Xaa-Pro aminopeptidase
MVIIQTSASYLGALTFGTSRRIEKDDVVTVWIESAAPSGYWLEYRRCYSFSPPPTEYRRVWDVTVAAVKAGLSVMKPGVMAHEFTAEVQRVYTEMAGWTCGFHDPKDIKDTYTLHGIGTDAIQGVWVQGKPRVLLENEVVNIHPWIRWADPSDATKYSWLGITDNVLITPKGGILMTHPPDVSDGFIQL